MPLSPYPFAPWPCLHAAQGPHYHPDPSCVLPICPQVWGPRGGSPQPRPAVSSGTSTPMCTGLWPLPVEPGGVMGQGAVAEEGT